MPKTMTKKDSARILRTMENMKEIGVCTMTIDSTKPWVMLKTRPFIEAATSGRFSVSVRKSTDTYGKVYYTARFTMNGVEFSSVVYDDELLKLGFDLVDGEPVKVQPQTA